MLFDELQTFARSDMPSIIDYLSNIFMIQLVQSKVE